MDTPTPDAPILILENEVRDGLSLSLAIRRAGINNPLVRLVNAASVEFYLNGTGQYSDRKKYPLPCLILLDLTLPKLFSGEMQPWLNPPPMARQIVVTALHGPLDPNQFESAVDFAPNSILCKLSTPESLAIMINQLRETALHREEPCLAVA